MLIVAEPYFKSMESARRYHNLAVDLGIPNVSVIANKVRPGEDSVIAEYCSLHGFELLGTVPFDAEFSEADRLGAAPIDLLPDSAGVKAICSLADALAVVS